MVLFSNIKNLEMSPTPTFSIIIPTFNSVEKFPAAIESIRRQVRSDVEVIVIDGMSKDGTVDYARQQTDIVSIVVSEKDKGIYDAINKGVKLANGRLIQVLGSDDILLDGSLDVVKSKWDEYPVDIIAGQALMVSDDNNKEELRKDEVYGPGVLLSGIPFCHNAMFATKKTYEGVGYYDLKYSICSDAHWVHRAIRNGYKCLKIDMPIVKFSLAGTSSTDAEKVLSETYDMISKNFKSLTIDEAEVLFRAIRGWSDGSDIPSVLSRHRANADFLYSVSFAFWSMSYAHHMSGNCSNSPAPILKKIKKKLLQFSDLFL